MIDQVMEDIRQPIDVRTARIVLIKNRSPECWVGCFVQQLERFLVKAMVEGELPRQGVLLPKRQSYWFSLSAAQPNVVGIQDVGEQASALRGVLVLG